MIYTIGREAPIGKAGGNEKHFLVGASVQAEEGEEPVGFVSIMDGADYSIGMLPFPFLEPENTWPYQALLPPMRGSAIVVDALGETVIVTILKDGVFVKSFVYDTMPESRELDRLSASFDLASAVIKEIDQYAGSIRASHFWAVEEYAAKLDGIKRLRMFALAGLVTTLLLLPIKGLDYLHVEEIKGRIESAKAEIAVIEGQIEAEKAKLANHGVTAREYFMAERITKALASLPDLPVKEFDSENGAVVLSVVRPDLVPAIPGARLVSPDTVSVPLPDIGSVVSGSSQ